MRGCLTADGPIPCTRTSTEHNIQIYAELTVGLLRVLIKLCTHHAIKSCVFVCKSGHNHFHIYLGQVVALCLPVEQWAILLPRTALRVHTHASNPCAKSQQKRGADGSRVPRATFYVVFAMPLQHTCIERQYVYMMLHALAA